MISSFRGDYFFLSNFYPRDFFYRNIKFPTAEHAYQSCKPLDLFERDEIIAANTPSYAKKLGRLCTLRANWGSVKLNIMYEVCKAKFSSPELAGWLEDTGNEELIEGNTWGDTFWGQYNGKGHNHLGKILMRVREEQR